MLFLEFFDYLSDNLDKIASYSSFVSSSLFLLR